jgi:oxygen-independent coproporphyrinogen-3 oxidase
VAEYLSALETEWTLRHSHTPFDLATLYFGGGTPSKLGGDGIARLMDVATRRATVRADAEVTLEANPEDVTAVAERKWKSAGVNRVSLGVQSFDDAVLSWMHRTHDASTAVRAIEILRDQGLDNLSIDLIFASPAVVPRAWEADLDQALESNVPHISVYGLTVERLTPLGRWIARHDVVEAPEERFEREFLLAHERLTAAGLEHYEVSNYGRAAFHSRHNWSYWQRRPYGGLGPSAHEFDGRCRRWNRAPYAQWVSVLASGLDPREGVEELSPEQRVAEEVYLSLRTTKGVEVSAAERSHVMPWVQSGWATLDRENTLSLTALGWLRLDALASDLTLLRSRC